MCTEIANDGYLSEFEIDKDEYLDLCSFNTTRILLLCSYYIGKKLQLWYNNTSLLTKVMDVTPGILDGTYVHTVRLLNEGVYTNVTPDTHQ